jgi:hypothetical protein
MPVSIGQTESVGDFLGAHVRPQSNAPGLCARALSNYLDTRRVLLKRYAKLFVLGRNFDGQIGSLVSVL